MCNDFDIASGSDTPFDHMHEFEITTHGDIGMGKATTIKMDGKTLVGLESIKVDIQADECNRVTLVFHGAPVRMAGLSEVVASIIEDSRIVDN